MMNLMMRSQQPGTLAGRSSGSSGGALRKTACMHPRPAPAAAGSSSVLAPRRCGGSAAMLPPLCRRGRRGISLPSLPGSAVPISTTAGDAASSKPANDKPAAAAAAAAIPQDYAGQRAVVVGAGPAGSTAAMFLARRGFSVDVYERRPEPASDAVDTGRAYIIILIPRGQAALSELGIELPKSGHNVSQGTVRHARSGKVSVTKEPGNVTFSRAGLAQFLIDEAKRRYPDKITFHFEAPCKAVDLDARTATFASGGASSAATTTTKPYDLLIGADGIQSAVRAAMQSADSSMTVEIADSGREYVTYRGLPDAGYAGAASVEPPEFAGNDGATLHLWASDDPFSSFTTHSDPDGTYSGTISLRTGGFESVKTAADFEALLTSKFTGIPEAWIAPIAAQAAGQTPSPAGKRTKCSTLCSSPRGRAVLIGDAAHSVTPVFGQGANSALESCLVLDKALAAAAGDVEAAPAAFDAARRADAHALQEVDRLAFSFFRRRGLLDPDFLSIFGHVILGTVLSNVVPFLYGPRPALLRLGSKDMPYSQILKAVRRDAAAAAVLVAGAVAWFAWRFFARLAATGGAAA